VRAKWVLRVSNIRSTDAGRSLAPTRTHGEKDDPTDHSRRSRQENSRGDRARHLMDRVAVQNWTFPRKRPRRSNGVHWLRGKRSARICLHTDRSHDSSVTGATQLASRRTESTKTESSRSRTCPTTPTRSTIASGATAIWVVSALKSSKSVRSAVGWRVQEILGTPRSILEKAGMRYETFFEAYRYV
jgi:hypothetical protein